MVFIADGQSIYCQWSIHLLPMVNAFIAKWSIDRAQSSLRERLGSGSRGFIGFWPYGCGARVLVIGFWLWGSGSRVLALGF